YGRPLYRLAYRMTGNSQDAEDLVQETFLRAHRAWPKFEARAQAGTWLYRICANAGLDLLRKRRPRVLPSSEVGAEPLDLLVNETPGPDRLLQGRETAAAFAAAFATLSPMERAAVSLRHFEDHSIAEISAMLGLRPTATKNTIFRGIRKLRRTLRPLMEGGSC
ncbi:MAG: RNA polymerase sigma factor, partial [Terriglobales bacterium]